MTVQLEDVYSNLQQMSFTGPQHEFTIMQGFNGMVGM